MRFAAGNDAVDSACGWAIDVCMPVLQSIPLLLLPSLRYLLLAVSSIVVSKVTPLKTVLTSGDPSSCYCRRRCPHGPTHWRFCRPRRVGDEWSRGFHRPPRLSVPSHAWDYRWCLLVWISAVHDFTRSIRTDTVKEKKDKRSLHEGYEACSVDSTHALQFSKQ